MLYLFFFNNRKKGVESKQDGSIILIGVSQVCEHSQ